MCASVGGCFRVYNLQVCMGSWVPVFGVYECFSGSCFGVYDTWLPVYSDYSVSLVACFVVYNILGYCNIARLSDLIGFGVSTVSKF